MTVGAEPPTRGVVFLISHHAVLASRSWCQRLWSVLAALSGPSKQLAQAGWCLLSSFQLPATSQVAWSLVMGSQGLRGQPAALGDSPRDGSPLLSGLGLSLLICVMGLDFLLLHSSPYNKKNIFFSVSSRRYGRS